MTIDPCFTVRHWSVTPAVVSLSSTESYAEAITKGCVAGLYMKHLFEHQTARLSKIEVWSDSTSSKAIMQRLGPGRRARHLEVQTSRVQQLVIDRSHLVKVDTLENVADVLTKLVPRVALDNVMVKKLPSVKRTRASARIVGIIVEHSLCSTVKKMRSWRRTCAALRTTRLVSRPPS